MDLRKPVRNRYVRLDQVPLRSESQELHMGQRTEHVQFEWSHPKPSDANGITNSRLFCVRESTLHVRVSL